MAHVTPAEFARHLFQLRDRHSRGIRATNQRARRRAGDCVNGNCVFFESAQYAYVRDAARGAARKRKTDARTIWRGWFVSHGWSKQKALSSRQKTETLPRITLSAYCLLLSADCLLFFHTGLSTVISARSRRPSTKVSICDPTFSSMSLCSISSCASTRVGTMCPLFRRRPYTSL